MDWLVFTDADSHQQNEVSVERVRVLRNGPAVLIPNAFVAERVAFESTV
jgi:predicted O-methyltransferase YrrM